MTVIAARPTTYNGIKMRSRLEARFAAFLDRMGFEWEYEPRAYGSTQGQYLPDFVVSQIGTLGPVYVEVKGAPPPIPMFPVMQRMEIVLQSEPRATLAFLVAAHAERDVAHWADLGVAGRRNWTRGGLAICRCGRVRFFDHYADRITVEEMRGLSDDEMWEPITYCDCGTPAVAAFVNPFEVR